MINEEYEGYTLTSMPEKNGWQKWSVGVVIKRIVDGEMRGRTFFAEDGINYILEVEAAKEGINLGKNLINNNMVGF